MLIEERECCTLDVWMVLTLIWLLAPRKEGTEDIVESFLRKYPRGTFCLEDTIQLFDF